MAPGASVFDSKVLCQEMSIAARRSGMLDAGLLLVSYTGEVPFPAVEVEKGNFFEEDSLLGVLIFAQYSGKNAFASLPQFHVFWWKRGLFRGTSCKNIMFHPSMSYISLICDPNFDLS